MVDWGEGAIKCVPFSKMIVSRFGFVGGNLLNKLEDPAQRFLSRCLINTLDTKLVIEGNI